MTTRGAVLQWMAAIGVAVTIAWSGGHARAQDGDQEDPIAQARQLFAEAEEAYGAHRYATAAELFRRVHELMEGHPRQYLVLFNLGQCLADAGEYEAGIETLERYLVAGGDRVENRGEVEQRIRALREMLGRDSTDDAATPPAPGDSTTQPDAAAPPPEPSGPDSGLMTGAIIGFAVGGAGLVSMGIFGGLALAEHDALANGCGATTSCTPDDIATSDTYALVADVSLGVGAAGLAAGLALTIVALATAGSDGSETAGLRVAPWVTANAGGVAGGMTW